MRREISPHALTGQISEEEHPDFKTLTEEVLVIARPSEDDQRQRDAVDRLASHHAERSTRNLDGECVKRVKTGRSKTAKKKRTFDNYDLSHEAPEL